MIRIKISFFSYFVYALKVFVILIISVVCLELLLRLTLNLALKRYLAQDTRQPYGERIKRIIFFPEEHTGDEYKADLICYYLPKDGLFFRGEKGRVRYHKVKVRGEIRVMCIGDSTTFGFTVDYCKSWPYLLEKLLKNKYTDVKISVLNAGIPGASSRQVKRVFQFHLIEYKPDIVLWRGGTALTDNYDFNPANIGKNNLRLLLWRIIYESRIFRVVCILLDKKSKGANVVNAAYDHILGRLRLEEKINGDVNSDFSLVKKIASDHGIKYVFQIEYLSYSEKNGIRSESVGLSGGLDDAAIIHTLGAFKEKAKGINYKQLFVDSVHLTEAGEAITAEEIYKFFLKEKLIDKIR
ncbi:MAG: SGNH/GDSL hydrolase family protein [Candidatus Omnitrophota bacterium]|jgi:lysophospholipase L1-like esterase